MFDVTSPESFQNLSKWRDELKTYLNEDVKLIVCGNKCDCQNKVLDKDIKM